MPLRVSRCLRQSEEDLDLADQIDVCNASAYADYSVRQALGGILIVGCDTATDSSKTVEIVSASLAECAKTLWT